MVLACHHQRGHPRNAPSVANSASARTTSEVPLLSKVRWLLDDEGLPAIGTVDWIKIRNLWRVSGVHVCPHAPGTGTRWLPAAVLPRITLSIYSGRRPAAGVPNLRARRPGRPVGQTYSVPTFLLIPASQHGLLTPWLSATESRVYTLVRWCRPIDAPPEIETLAGRSRSRTAARTSCHLLIRQLAVPTRAAGLILVTERLADEHHSRVTDGLRVRETPAVSNIR